MTDADFMRALVGGSGDFDHSMMWLAKRGFASPSERASFVASAIRTLSSSILSRREIDRRCRLVFDRIRNDETLLRLVVQGVQGVEPSALNAIRSLLPSHLRPLAVSRSATPAVPSSPYALSETEAAEKRDQQAQREQRSERIPTVVLVGTEVEHVANRALLTRNSFEPLRVPSLEKLWTVANTGLCGFVIAPSAWSGLAASEQRRAIDRLCSWSTFTFARLSLAGVDPSVAEDFPSLLQAGLGRPSSDRFCHGSNSDLTGADIALLRDSAMMLATADETRFVPLDVSREDALLLRLIAGHRRPHDRPVDVRHLAAATLPGGRSRARVFVLQAQGETGRRFVVKLDEPSKLREELDRYKRWILDWEPTVTDPVIHHHEGRSAVSYRLQADADGTDRPAPTLESELEHLRNLEWWKPSPDIESAAELGEKLEAALLRAAGHLAQLNKRKATEAGVEFWLHWPAMALVSRSISHELIRNDGTSFDLASIVKVAVDGLAPLHDKGIVHGDIHGRNVLLVDRLPVFIDFDKSGPGNPLVDLVRLDATVRDLVMRALVGERSLVELYVALYVDGTSAADVAAKHPGIAASPGCMLALTVAERTRTHALGVAESFGRGYREYLCMVVVIASHMLTLRAPGSAIERALLAAIAPVLSEVPSHASTERAHASDSASTDPPVAASDG